MTYRLSAKAAIAAAFLLVCSTLAFSGPVSADNGTDDDATIEPATTEPVVGESFDVAVGGLEPATEYAIRLCASYTGTGLVLFDENSCSHLADVTTDDAGGAGATVSVPAGRVGLDRLCTYEPGPGSMSFGGGPTTTVVDPSVPTTTVVGGESSLSFPDPGGESSLSFGYEVSQPCKLAVTQGDSVGARFTPLTVAPIEPRLGTGSISGTVVDSSSGDPLDLSGSAFTLCALDMATSCKEFYGSGAVPGFVTDGSTYWFNGLPDGRFVVALWYPGGDFTTATVADGGETSGVDLDSALAYTPEGHNTGAAVEVSGPADPITFDETISATATGFQPGDVVRASLCGGPFSPVFVGMAELQQACGGLGAPAPVEQVADGSGEVHFELPFDAARFGANCPFYFATGDETSLSFGIETICRLFVWDSTDEPAAAWTSIDFETPVGAATVSGVVSINGVPAEGVALSMIGPTGLGFLTTGPDGAFSRTGLPDGDYTLTPSLPGNYFLDPENPPSTTPLTIEQQADEVVDIQIVVPTGSISGTVVDHNGNPVPGASVYAYSDGDGAVAPTGQDGSFELLGTPPGEYTVLAFGPFGTTEEAVQVGDDPVTGITLVLPGHDGGGLTVELMSGSSPNPNGWYSEQVNVWVNASSPLGVSVKDLFVDGTPTGTDAEVLGEGIHDVFGRAYNWADGWVSTDVQTFRIDTTQPTVSVSHPTEGMTFEVGEEVTPEFDCADELSGIETCVVLQTTGPDLDTSSPGSKEFVVRATDLAGNSQTAAIGYEVVEPTTSMDQLSLQFRGSLNGTWDGDASEGDIVVERNADGRVASILGSARIPGAGGGEATVTFSIRKLWIFDAYFGNIIVKDPEASLNVNVPVLPGPIYEAPDSTLSGSASWFQGWFRWYTLQWSVLDTAGTDTPI